ncbi:MAG: type I restriction enzyme HsdR N-terminal domain-containing protein [Pseudodesulfovibrio sp.]
MHESSLGGTLRDYLTGEEIDETTFEEFRQMLARLLIEELGYPRERIRAKVPIKYAVEGEEFERPIDYVVYDENDRPIFIVLFCAGDVSTFERETVCAGRLIEGGPVPFALITDTMEALLLDVCTGEVVARGMRAVPDWGRLNAMAAEAVIKPLAGEQREKQIRVFHTYCGFVYGACCSESCTLPPLPQKKS